MDGVKQLLVSSEKLREKAGKFEATLKRAKKNCERIRQLSGETKVCFDAGAAKAFRTELEKRLVLLEEEIQKLQIPCYSLYDIAEEYEQAEGENENVLTGNRSALRTNAANQSKTYSAGRKDQ